MSWVLHDPLSKHHSHVVKYCNCTLTSEYTFKCNTTLMLCCFVFIRDCAPLPVGFIAPAEEEDQLLIMTVSIHRRHVYIILCLYSLQRS